MVEAKSDWKVVLEFWRAGKSGPCSHSPAQNGGYQGGCGGREQTALFGDVKFGDPASETFS